MRRWLPIVLVATAVPMVSVAQVSSDAVGYRGWGPRVGLTVDPDQIHFGVHSDFGYMAHRVRFQPNLEIGVLDDVTIAAFNFEATYRFRRTWDAWAPYAGGGPSLNVVNRDGPGDDSERSCGVDY